METYYFTFGQNHVQLDGTPMKDYYITVEGDYYAARNKICNWLLNTWVLRTNGHFNIQKQISTLITSPKENT